MASIRPRDRSDGTEYFAVLFRLDGKQTSVSLPTRPEAEYFADLIDRVGAARALELQNITRTGPDPLTVGQYLRQHIDQLTGVEQATIDRYNGYLKNDIEPTLGTIPLRDLSEADIGIWVRKLEEMPGRGGKTSSPKTIANKHGFLSGALGAAIPRHIPANPAAGRTLPRGTGDDHEPVFLSRDEFRLLHSSITEPWRPMVEFLVTSGCRWGEAVALRPSDVDREAGKVHVRRATKYSPTNGYEIGAPKTKRSRRTIDISKSMLDKLDYGGEWLFVNRTGGPVRYYGFMRRVWNPATKRAALDPRPTPHDLRHTSASWMLNNGVPITTVSRRLGHESIKVTVDVYGHLSDATGQAAAAVFDDALADAPDEEPRTDPDD